MKNIACIVLLLSSIGCATQRPLNNDPSVSRSAADLNSDSSSNTRPVMPAPHPTGPGPVDPTVQADPDGDVAPMNTCKAGEVTREQSGKIVCMSPEKANRLDRTTGR